MLLSIMSNLKKTFDQPSYPKLAFSIWLPFGNQGKTSPDSLRGLQVRHLQISLYELCICLFAPRLVMRPVVAPPAFSFVFDLSPASRCT
ncbi:unnamed protein product [Chondrus crispus]|uniref:Uncharacterized protein n=1 Tax=Chondrus crispus TaxID=2769 RepID=R7QI05_CHOCR|nr:unnamed protein product [Chondrus crispus]CDF37096.1 unnamed protein product [Chondrus crispus]|eukprot:XP_005716915.1 unnamed protein product [Chondrus crispus]